MTGVAQVQVFGQQKFAVRVDVDPDKAAARGLTLDNVQNAVAAANSSTPVGAMLGAKQNVTVDATGQMPRAAQYDNLVIAWRNGAPVRLNEIARVYDSVENNQLAGWVGDSRSIVLAIFRQSDANTVDVVDSVKAKIPYYQSQLPPSVDVKILNDRSVSIRQSIDDVQHTLMLSIVLVIAVIFIFLKSASGGPSSPGAAGAAGFADRHLRVHVCVRLFDRQYIPVGDYALGRFRGRRRHRYA